VTVPAGATTVRWERLHPLSPIVRGGRAALSLVGLLIFASVQGRGGGQSRIDLDIVLVVIIGVLGFVNWAVTRWAFDGATLRFETGLLRRDARQLPVARIQAVDIVQPLLARFAGLSEVKITLAGGGRETRLAYLSDDRATRLRAALLAAHHGQDPSTPEPAEVMALAVPTRLLAGSVALSAPTFILAVLIASVVVVAATSPRGLPSAFAVMATYVLAMGTAVWRRFNVQYGFTVASSPDGIRIRRGLVGTVSETIPIRRIQAVSQVEPLLWRMLGWCRLEVVLARTPGRDSGSGSSQVRKTLLPVGSAQVAQALRTMVIGSVTFQPTRPPRRARFKSPLSYHFLTAGHDDTLAVAVTGRVRRRTDWVPLEKVQSVRRIQGPLQRRLRLATVHVDVAGRSEEAIFRDRDVIEAEALVTELAALSRVARTHALPDPRPHAGGDAPTPVAVAAPPPPEAPTPPPAPGPGWYGDPSGRHRARFWDGRVWTEDVHDVGPTTTSDPLGG